MSDLIIRPLVAGGESLFDSLPDPGLVGFAAFGDKYAEMAARGQYRPEWTWVALRGDTVVARAAWFGGAEDDQPLALDWFDFTDSEAGVALLRESPFRTEYSLLLPPGWRDDPAVAAAANARVDAYVGVVPEHRGHGYAYDLLVEATHHLVEQGADRIVAGTDITNVPMAAAFARAGYPVAQHRIDLV